MMGFWWCTSGLPWIPPMQAVNQIAENNDVYSSYAFKKSQAYIQG